MRMTDPKITVAMMTRNRPHLLRLALESVLAQRGVELDVIVIDNASEDDTPDIVKSVAARDARVRYMRNEHDIGIVRNWNRAIDAATARAPFVSIFHDDDIMLEGFLAESTRALLAHPSAGMSLCLAQYTKQDGTPTEVQSHGDVKPGLNAGFDFLELVVQGRAMDIPPPIVCFRSDVLKRAGAADSPHTRGTMDMNLYYRTAAISDVVLIPRPLVQYRMHEGSDTELLNRTAGGTFWYGTMAERIDAIAYLLRTPRADDPEYRRWLVGRLLEAHKHASAAIQPSVPMMYHTWDNRRAIFLEQLDRVLPPGERFILIDDGALGLDGAFNGRAAIPFLEREGQYWGPPRRDQDAISDLERLRGAGVQWLVIAWPSLWWLDQYGNFDRHLRGSSQLVLDSPHGLVFRASMLDHG
jgi:glycosyltransferase involved in cell wall biosynthesis